MATYIRGNSVNNATSYTLYRKSGGAYTPVETKNMIDFEISALSLPAGDYVFAVKAKAEGYADSEYSNELTYTIAKNYDSYIGTEYFKNAGMRISRNGSEPWAETTVSGATATSTTDLIQVVSTDRVWIQYVFNKTATMAVGGFYDTEGNLVAPLYYADFGLEMNESASGAAAFTTPDESSAVSVAHIESTTGKTVKYVKFTAWGSSTGGLNNTEARIYH